MGLTCWKSQRELPPGLSPRDQKILKKVQKRARRLDRGIRLCGFRFGWTFIIGFIPVVGDVVLAAFKANSRNAALLEEFLRIRGEELIRLQQGGASVSQATKPTAPEGKKGKGQVVPGVAKADAEQVKPGAGAPSRPAQRATTSTETNVSGKSKRSFRAWFGGGGSQKDKNKGKQLPPPLPPAGDRGRFVENLDDGHRTA